MEKLFKWGRNTLAIVPGLTLIFTNLWLPAELPRLLMSGIMEATGALTLIVFFKKGSKLKKTPIATLNTRAIIFLALFVLCLFSYIIIYYCQDIHSSKYDTTILLPFWKSNELKYMLEKSGSANSALLNYGPEPIRKAISDNPIGFSATIICFMTIYILIFEFLIISFGLISIIDNQKLTFKNVVAD